MSHDWVRVRHAQTRHEYTVSRLEAGLDKDLEILPNKEAVDVNGRPLPPHNRESFTPIPAPATPKHEKGTDQ